MVFGNYKNYIEPSLIIISSYVL